MNKSKNLFSKDSGIFSKKFILESGIPLVIFGRNTEKERFVILKLRDFFKLTNSLLKNGKKDTKIKF